MTWPFPKFLHGLGRRPWRALVILGGLILLCLGAGTVAAYLQADYHFHAAQRALGASQLDEAQQYLDRCLAWWPRNAQAHLLAAQTARRRDDPDQAQRHLAHYQLLRGEAVQVDLEEALRRIQGGDLNAATASLRTLADSGQPESDLVLEALARGYLSTRQWPEALPCLNSLVQRQPAHWRAFLWRAQTREGLEHFEEAWDDYRQAVVLAPNSVLARLGLANSLARLGRAREAVTHYEELRRQQPDNADVIVGLSRCRHDLHELSEARQLLDRLLAEQPEQVSALLERDRMAWRLGQPAEPEGDFRRAAADSSAVLRGPHPAPTVEATSEQVHAFCGACHAYPPPDTFPRSAWGREVAQGYDFFRRSMLRLDFPSLEEVVRYYESRAPHELPLPAKELPSGRGRVRFERTGYPLSAGWPYPAVTNVNLVHLFDERKLDVLVCDARLGQVLVFTPYEPAPSTSRWQALAPVPAPAHAEVVDLDGDGQKDILVANLGSFYPTDGKVGSVVWLRGLGGGKFTPITLLDGVGRVADVQAADFKGNGKLDLVVAVFGWRETGEVLYLENQTTDWSHPVFVPHVLDNRHGAIHVPVGDINGDGRPDFAALISQEHETVVAFLNEGNGRFRKETIYTAPHPAYGSSGIQLVDLNGDGRLDVLYTNGDVMDRPRLLKPYHGIQWLENQGRFPFAHHALATMYGVQRAVAADLDGDGDLDIAAVSYLPAEEFPQRGELKLDAVLWLEQTSPGRFVRHSLETGSCDHFTCAAGDVHGDGKVHLVTGNFCQTKARALADTVVLWKIVGERGASAP